MILMMMGGGRRGRGSVTIATLCIIISGGGRRRGVRIGSKGRRKRARGTVLISAAADSVPRLFPLPRRVGVGSNSFIATTVSALLHVIASIDIPTTTTTPVVGMVAPPSVSLRLASRILIPTSSISIIIAYSPSVSASPALGIVAALKCAQKRLV